MSDHFETLVFLGVSKEAVAAVAEKATGWLVDQRIVEAAVTDCALGVGGGRRPGAEAERGCDVAHTTPDGLALWRTLVVNGVEIVTGGVVAVRMDDAPGALWCPHCGTEMAFGDFDEAMTAWHDRGEALLDCRACGVASPLDAWGGEDWAFGRLALTFWNWPPLTTALVQEIESVTGYKARVIPGRV